MTSHSKSYASKELRHFSAYSYESTLLKWLSFSNRRYQVTQEEEAEYRYPLRMYQRKVLSCSFFFYWLTTFRLFWFTYVTNITSQDWKYPCVKVRIKIPWITNLLIINMKKRFLCGYCQLYHANRNSILLKPWTGKLLMAMQEILKHFQ